MADARKNFAASTVAVPPSPATSGATLTVGAGHGARFPTPPFNAVLTPPGWDGDPSTAEIVRVTAATGDGITAMTRAQEDTTAQAVAAGWGITAPVTAKSLADLTFANMTPDGQGWPNLAALASGSPTPPGSGVTLFGRSIAGRILPAVIGPAGIDTALMPHVGRNKIGWASPAGGSATLLAMGTSVTATGTATAKTFATTNLYASMAGVEYLVTTAAATAVAGFRQATSSLWRGTAAGLGGFHVVIRWGPATGQTGLATRRAFCGIGPTTPSDVNPSTLTNIAGMGWDAADTNVQMMFNDGAGAATKIDLGVARPSTDRTAVYEVALFAPPNGSFIDWAVADLRTDTVLGSGRATTDLISATTFVGPRGYCSVGGTSSVVGFCLMGYTTETDR